MKPFALALSTVTAFLLVVCTKPVDKAAKKRIFSPEDPPKVVSSASESLPSDKLAEDPRIARRVLQMEASEVTERVGPHRYRATMEFEWTGAGQTLRLTETRILIAGPGGVNGDFHGTVENSRGQGLDVIRVNGSVFARNRYGKYRQRLRDQGMAEREREEIHGALRAYDSLFRGRLKLTLQGRTTVGGRDAYRYVVSLDDAQAADQKSDSAELPHLLASKGGMDESSAHRQAFFQDRQPQSLNGEIALDAERSVVLQAHLEGRLSIVGEKDSGGLALKLALSLSEIGVDPHLEAPKGFLPDIDKPKGIAAALDRFGIPRGPKRDAGSEESDDEG